MVTEGPRGAFEAAGLYDKARRSGLHMLRRSFASLAIGSTDLVTVKELLGHEKVETTMLYVTSNSDRKRAAVSNLGPVHGSLPFASPILRVLQTKQALFIQLHKSLNLLGSAPNSFRFTQQLNGGRMDVGRRLRELREGAALSQRALAKHCGISNATISPIEAGKLNPSVAVLKRILDGIPTDLASFFSERVTAPHTPVPFSAVLEDAFIPSAEKVVTAVHELG